MFIISHRGLKPSKEGYYVESSLEAFEDQLAAGFGLEFDLQSTKDGKIVISHDSDLRRISNGKDTRHIKDLTLQEVTSLVFNDCHLASLSRILSLIEKDGHKLSIHAIHLRRSSQTKELLDTLLEELRAVDTEKFILFDVTLETAEYLKRKNQNLNLAPSIAHPFDIERYNSVVGGTLITAKKALPHSNIFSWVWLDEWDLADKNNGFKKLYTAELFEKLRHRGLKIALVTPELHATSPGLLGNESHPDAKTKDRLFDRIKEIIKLNPDALCTDYSDEVKEILLHETNYN